MMIKKKKIVNLKKLIFGLNLKKYQTANKLVKMEI